MFEHGFNIQAYATPLMYVATSAPVVPANALKDEAGNPILDENGNYILTE